MSWLMIGIWLLIGFVALVARLRFDKSFGGWMLMLSDSRHGTQWICLLIVFVLILFCPLHILVRNR